MDVGRPLVEGVVEEVLDGVDDVLIVGLDVLDALELDVALEVSDVDAALDLLFGAGDRAAEAVEVGDEALDVRRGRHHEHRAALHVVDEVVDEAAIVRIGDGHGHRTSVGADHERRMSPREGAREELRRQLRVDLERVELDEREVRGGRDELHDDALGDPASLVSGRYEVHRDEDLGGVHDGIRGGATGHRTTAARAHEARALAVFTHVRVARLCGAEDSRLHEEPDDDVERESSVLRHKETLAGSSR